MSTWGQYRNYANKFRYQAVRMVLVEHRRVWEVATECRFLLSERLAVFVVDRCKSAGNQEIFRADFS